MNENLDYIKNAFTKSNEQVNLEIDNLNVGCITSKNSNFELDSEGNLVVKSIKIGEIPKNMLDFIYPIGSIYISVNNTDPSAMFGGQWEQIKDRFLLSSGDVYENNTIGGSATVCLSEENLPSHTHSLALNSHSHSIPEITLTSSKTGSHSHTGNTLEIKQPNSWNFANDCARPIASSADYKDVKLTNSAGNHQHTVTIPQRNTRAQSITGSIGASGLGLEHNNMPPYLVVNIWKRTL